jgi:hypothetical protein
MDSQILRLLIFSLLVTLSLCSVIQKTQLAYFNGTLPLYPQASSIPNNPVNFTGYPGQALIEISAFSSVAVCISSYAPITSNFAVQCPNAINFIYDSSSQVNEFLLFLDDFSMNFLGQDSKNTGRMNKRDQNKEISYSAYDFQNQDVTLLQDIPYFITISLLDDSANDANNDTLRDATFTLYAQFGNCPADQVPNVQFGEKGNLDKRCKSVDSQLNTTSSSSGPTPLSVTKFNPILISFELTSISFSAQLDFHINAEKYNFTIYFGFEYAPTSTNFDFSFSNSSDGTLNELDFLGEIGQSFSVQIPNPQTGVYYAQVTSDFELPTTFTIEFNTTSCTLGVDGGCGTLDIFELTPGNNNNLTNLTNVGNTPQYVSISGDTVLIGFDTNTTSQALVQIGVNFVPSGIPITSGTATVIQSIANATLFTLTGVDSNDDFVISFENAADFTADTLPNILVWSGFICPANCSSRGVCDTTTFQCGCQKGFEGRYCQLVSPKHKKLSTLYIILIIIGGAILLAILIGVPVALFLNNRKKARYERV